MDTATQVVGWLLAGFIVAGIVWAIRRGKQGYQNVQALMARVDAAASADARAAAQSVVNIGGIGPGGRPDYDNFGGAYYDDLRGDYDHSLDHDHHSRSLGRGSVDPRGATGAADGARVRFGARRVLPGDAVRDQGDSLNGWAPWD